MTTTTINPATLDVRIGDELGRGGEGGVFAIRDRPDLVAKVYWTPPSKEKQSKLEAMVAVRTESIARIAAWPAAVVRSRGTIVGFTMPRIVARKDIHELYSPKSRYEAFPEADFRFLVHVAANIARAFGIVHQAGQVIGDVNHGNLLVAPNGTVTLIDCDSFQIRAERQVFTCDVGVPLFTAPELQGRQFRGLERTPNHDGFGLAVLLFHLLFLGRHPFAGRYLGRGEMPVEQAIAEGRFPYGADHNAKQVDPPPGTPPLSVLGTEIAALFGRAFSLGATSRPSAVEWVAALDRLEKSLRQCRVAPWHHYAGTLTQCPWCAVEAQTGMRLFGQRIAMTGPGGATNVAALWAAIRAIPAPPPPPPLPSAKAWVPAPGTALPSGNGMKTLRQWLAVAVGVGGFFAISVSPIITMVAVGAAIAVWPRVAPEKQRAARAEIDNAQRTWQQLSSQWDQQAGGARFTSLFNELDQARKQLAALPQERALRIAKLEAERERLQRERYLDRFRIDRASIKGIGTSRQAMLASFGVETASDVQPNRIRNIPGFGEVLTAELLNWRRGHERNFRFNPNEPVDPREVAKVDQELQTRQRALVTTMQQGVSRLQQARQETVAARERLARPLEAAWNDLKLAEAKMRAL